MSYVYIKSDDVLWTVGHYGPGGTWVPESDHEQRDAAAARVHWLNGGAFESLESRVDALEARSRYSR